MKHDRDLLLVIDFQNIYLPGQEWACPSMPKAAANTRKILDLGCTANVLFTQFLSSPDPIGTWGTYNREYRIFNENPFLCDIIPELKPYLDRYPLGVKSTYSSMKCSQVLEAALEADRIVLTGVVAECCILSTMMEAIDLGFQTVYLTDCISGQTEENEAAIRKIAESFSPIHTLVMDSGAYMAEE